MRFFNIALPVFMGLFVAASPILSEKDTNVAAVVEKRQDLDIVGLLNGLTSGIAQQGAAIQANPTDEATVAGGLSGITDLLNGVIGTLTANGANTDPSSLGLGGLLGGLLGRDFDGNMEKRQAYLNSVATALQGVLTQLQSVLLTLPPATIALPLVGPLLTALTPLLVTLVAGVNSLVPGLIVLVRSLLVTVSGLLLSL